MVINDTKNQIKSPFPQIIQNIPISIRIKFDYSCTFTTVNCIGRYGPTNVGDTKLDDEQKGMQLWTTPN